MLITLYHSNRSLSCSKTMHTFLYSPTQLSSLTLYDPFSALYGWIQTTKHQPFTLNKDLIKVNLKPFQLCSTLKFSFLTFLKQDPTLGYSHFLKTWNWITIHQKLTMGCSDMVVICLLLLLLGMHDIIGMISVSADIGLKMKYWILTNMLISADIIIQ